MGTTVLPTTPGNQPSAQQDPSRQSTPNLGCCCRTVCWKGLSSAPAGEMARTLPKAEQPLGPHPRMVDELPRARAGTRKRPGWIEDAVRGQQTRWAERKSRRDSPGSSRKSFAAGTRQFDVCVHWEVPQYRRGFIRVPLYVNSSMGTLCWQGRAVQDSRAIAASVFGMLLSQHASS